VFLFLTALTLSSELGMEAEVRYPESTPETSTRELSCRSEKVRVEVSRPNELSLLWNVLDMRIISASEQI